MSFGQSALRRISDRQHRFESIKWDVPAWHVLSERARNRAEIGPTDRAGYRGATVKGLDRTNQRLAVGVGA